MKNDLTSYYGSERGFCNFRRSVPAPAIIPGKNVTVDYEDGVLTVVFKKLEFEKPEGATIKVL